MAISAVRCRSHVRHWCVVDSFTSCCCRRLFSVAEGSSCAFEVVMVKGSVVFADASRSRT